MQFSGFGELQGVPGHCVNPDTNAEVPCGQNLRWVPAFDIVDGTSVTGGGATYFVKFLECELRLGKLAGTAETTCKANLGLSGARFASCSATAPRCRLAAGFDAGAGVDGRHA